MEFFKTVYSICSGPSVFPVLMTRSPLRALFHLFLLCFLLALLISGIKSMELQRDRRIITDAMGEYFGDLVISKKGILPLRNAEKPKTFLLTPEIRFDYLTKESLNLLDGMGDWTENTGVIWCPRGFLLWKRMPDAARKFVLMPLPPPVFRYYAAFMPFDMVSSSQLNPVEVRNYISKNCFLSGTETYPISDEVKISPTDISSKIMTFFVLLLFFSALIEIFFITMVTSLLFALAQHLFVSKADVRLKFGALLTVMIYSAFPALLIASAAEITGMQFLSFQTIFFIVFFLYQMFAFSAVQRFLNPPPPRSEKDDDQDYF